MTTLAVSRCVWQTLAAATVQGAALQGLGRTDEMLAVSAAIVAEESQRRGGSPGVAWARHAMGLTIAGRIAEARVALSRFVEHTRSSGWEWFWSYSRTFVVFALREHQFAAAARMHGYWDTHVGDDGQRTPLNRFFAERTMEALKAELDSATIERLMAEGAQLDEEAVCALALALPPSGTDSTSLAR